MPGYLIALLLFFAGSTSAQYPARTVTIIVPFTAGSDADLSARNLAQHAEKHLGRHPIIVTNQPGASGAIGSMAVKNAAPDGHTLLLARIASHVILPATEPKTPYRWNDFTQIGLLELNPYVCAARREAPWRDMRDVVEEVRRAPGKLNFATVGAGTLQNFGPRYLFSLAGLPKDAAVGVPYKGSGELTTALLGGQVHFACSNLGALLGHFRSGALRALMTTTREPLNELPDAPTARSLGWPQMESLGAWSALAGPPGLPRDVVDQWAQALQKLASDPGWLAGNEKLGGIPAIRAPAETEQFVREQAELYERLSR